MRSKIYEGEQDTNQRLYSTGNTQALVLVLISLLIAFTYLGDPTTCAGSWIYGGQDGMAGYHRRWPFF